MLTGELEFSLVFYPPRLSIGMNYGTNGSLYVKNKINNIIRKIDIHLSYEIV